MANTLRFKRGLASGIPTALAGEPLFTTDTFDLYIGNGTTNTRFQKYIASGTTSQLLRGDGSLLTMPIVLTSPANGQVLKYNGTSWVNDSDAGITGSGANTRVAFWTGASTQSSNANFIWDNTNSRLGVGGTFAETTLHVNGSVFIGGSSTIGLQLENALTSAPSSNVRSIIANTSSSIAVAGALFLQPRTGVAAPILFYTEGSERARIFATGNFGIGTGASDSGEKLQVTGTAKITGAASFNTSITNGGWSSNGLPVSAGTAQVFNRFLNTSGDFYVGLEGSTGGGYFNGSSAYASVLYSSQPIQLITGGVKRLDISSAGAVFSGAASIAGNLTVDTNTLFVDATNNRVGIGTAAPAVALEVAGASTQQVRVTSTSGADMRINADTVGRVGTYSNSNLAVITNSAAIATFFTTGNLALNSVLDTGERLQVTGTAKITSDTYIGTRIAVGLTGGSLFAPLTVVTANHRAEFVQSSITEFAVESLNTARSTSTDIGIYSKQFALYTRTGGTGSYTQKLLLTDTGNLGLGVTTNNASAKFQVDSTTQGILPPRMTTTQKNAIATPAAGLMVYDTTTNKLCCYNGTTWNDLF